MTAAPFRTGDLRRLTLRFSALHCLIAALSPVSSFLLGGAAKIVFGKAIWPIPRQLYSDLAIYFHYASTAIGGKVPYRDFFLEYPPLSVPFMVFLRRATRPPSVGPSPTLSHRTLPQLLQ